MSQNTTPFEQQVFTVEERDRVQARILEIAHADRRIVAGALLGSLVLVARPTRLSCQQQPFAHCPSNLFGCRRKAHLSGLSAW